MTSRSVRQLPKLPGYTIIAFISLLVLAPLAIALSTAIQPDGGALATFADWTPRNLIDVVSRSDYLDPIRQTISLSVIVTVGSVVIGGSTAWIFVHEDVPLKRTLEFLVLLPFFFSPFAIAIAWSILLAGRSGVINIGVDSYFGFNIDSLTIYSYWGVCFVMITAFSPLAHLSLIGLMKNIDSEVEEAARLHGAGGFALIRTVTIPLLRPGLISASMLIFVLAAETYTVPGFLGAPAGVDNLAYKIVQDMTGFPQRQGHAAASAIVLLAIALTGIFFYRSATRQASRFATIGGKGGNRKQRKLGPYRLLALVPLVFYAAIAVIAPVGGLVIGALQKYYGAPLALQNFGLAQLRRVFTQPAYTDAITHTVIVAVLAATATVLLSLGVTYISVRTKLRGRSLLDVVSTLPIAVPGVVMGLGMLVLYVRTPIYGTILLLVIVNATRWMPFGTGVLRNGLLQISAQLDESAAVSGASTTRRVMDISWPLLKPAIFSAWILIAIMTTKELAASLLLVTPDNNVLAVATWDAAQTGTYNLAASLCLVQILIMFTLYTAARWVLKVDPAYVGR